MVSKHDHVGNMLFDDDYCVCRVCRQAWNLDLKRGWIPEGHGQLGTTKPKYYKAKAKGKSSGVLGSRQSKSASSGKVVVRRPARPVLSKT